MDELNRFSNRPVAFILRHVRRRAVSHVAILLSVVGAVACSVGSQYGLKMLVDTLSSGPTSDSPVWRPLILLVALIATDNLLWRVGGWIASSCFVAVTGDVRSELFRYLTGQAPDYFADRPPGTLSSRITAAANAIFTGETMFAWNVLPPCLATAGAIGFLATVNSEMTGLLVVVAAIMVAVLMRLAATGRPIHRRFAERAAEVDGEMVDVLANLPVVRAFGGWGREHRRFDLAVDREMGARRHSLRYLEKIRLSHAIITAAFTAGLMAWSVALWRHGAATAGDVVLVCSLGFTVLHGTRDLAVALVDVTQHLARLAETLATLLLPHTQQDQPSARPLAVCGGEIVFDRISFTYPGEAPLFESFTLRIAPGERVGLIGPSGCGKTTLLKLLQHLYEVEQGRILIDGQNIAEAKLESLIATFAVVPQEPFLFQRSIMENILYGRTGATPEEAIAAAQAACCADFVESLADGYGTIVGDHGTKLSGGQRQRIAIARALLKDGPIVLLDEATSALDADSETAVRQALSHLMIGKTVIAVAHRLSTLRDFDRIVVIKDGRVVQDGPPDQLWRRDGPYRRLVQGEVDRLSRHSA